MCFSADASLASGIVLVPVGAYCVRAALLKNVVYVPVAATPLVFGIQQLCEAFVWRGLVHNDAVETECAALAFLFFAIAFWPGWVPFAAAAVEPEPVRRRWYFIAAAIGFTMGVACYVPAALHYGVWLEVQIADHSIRYDFTHLPYAHRIAAIVWAALYLALVCTPLLLSRNRQLHLLGISIAASAAITHVMFWYAFVSVWCFFAALLSAQIIYVLHRVPKLEAQPIVAVAAPSIGP